MKLPLQGKVQRCDALDIAERMYYSLRVLHTDNPVKRCLRAKRTKKTNVSDQWKARFCLKNYFLPFDASLFLRSILWIDNHVLQTISRGIYVQGCAIHRPTFTFLIPLHCYWLASVLPANNLYCGVDRYSDTLEISLLSATNFFPYIVKASVKKN